MSTLGMKRGNGQQSRVDGPEPRASSLGISEPCSLCGRWTGTSLGKACHCAAAEAEFNVATQKARHWGVWGRERWGNEPAAPVRGRKMGSSGANLRRNWLPSSNTGDRTTVALLHFP